MQWETVIGLEIHAQLATDSKIFSGAATTYGAEPNTQACAVDLGLPGVLPVVNERVIEMATRFGLAIDAEISKKSVFARKNYFYPDLPKGYQISQLDHPIVGLGKLDITLEDGSIKTIGVTRAHLEEDAGKSIHDMFDDKTGVDLNRAGTPLIEIVSEPDMSNAKEAIAYMKKIHALVQYLEICDGNMQEGSFRCDANVSIRPVGQEKLGTRTELKNLNSFRFIERAINIEVERQIDILENGGEITQETRLYDADKDETRSMRSKEEANDYRYFPDPDLLPIMIDDVYIDAIRQQMPELPDAKKARFIESFGLNDYDASNLTSDRATSEYFETVINGNEKRAKLAANWINSELSGALNDANLDIKQSPVNADALSLLLTRIEDNTISGKIAKEVFKGMWNQEGTADDIIDAKGLKQITDDSAIEAIIDEIIANNQGQVEQYQSGKEKVFGFFVGQVMKATQGKANPAQANALLKKKLKP